MSERRIALLRAVGWRVKRGEDGWYYGLVNPAGNITIDNVYDTEADAWAAAPDYETDVEAGIAALDALSASSTCIACRLDNNKWIDGKRVWVCEIIDVDVRAVTAYGATPALAITAALCAYYRIGESVK